MATIKNKRDREEKKGEEEEKTYNNISSLTELIPVKEEQGEEPLSEEEEPESNQLSQSDDSESKKKKNTIPKKNHKKKKKDDSEEYQVKYEDYDSEDDEEDWVDEDESNNDDEYANNDDDDNKKKKKLTNRKRKRPGKKKNKSKRERIGAYFEGEAEESDDEEGSDDEDGEITKVQQEKILAELNQKKMVPKRIQELSEEDILQRYNRMEYIDNEPVDPNDEIGRNALQPSIADPKLWLVKCRPGKEKESVENLFHKYFYFNKDEDKIKILSAACFDSLKGYIYIEAYKEANVREAISGISNLRDNSNSIKIVPISEMTQVFSFDKIQKIDLKPKQWVRVKSGIYEGDLAQVIHIEDPINKIYVRIIPRILENASTSPAKKDSIADYNKKLKKCIKPRQKLFNPTHYSKIDNKSHQIFGNVTLWNKQTFKDGFLIKTVKAKSLITEDVVPKIEELRIFDLTRYKRGEEDDENPDGNPNTMDIDYLVNTIQDTEITKKKKFNKGDKVKLVKGGLNGITGKVVSHNNKIVQILCNVEGMDNNILEFPEDYLIKDFLPGDMVQVINGPQIGKRGIIVNIEEDTAIVYSDDTKTEFKVSCHDLISSTFLQYESEQNPYYHLGDLVKINGTSAVCYVLDVQKYSLRLIDTRSEIKNGSIKDVIKISNHKPNSIDSKRNPITKNDTVKIINGPYKGRNGVIKNVFSRFLFLYNKDFVTTNGIFVDKSENVEILGSELLVEANDLTRGRVNMKRIPEEIRKLVGSPVNIIRGVWKGYSGIVRDVTDKVGYVELYSKNKTVSVELAAIQDTKKDVSANVKGYDSMTTPRSMMNPKTPAYYPQSPSFNPTQSPRWMASSTPNYYQAISPNPNYK